jgi:hypothetical protein
LTKTIHGTVHGKTIDLDEEPGVADGEEVEVTIRTISDPTVHRSGEGFSRTEGALADDTEWDAIMDEIYRARKQERRPQIPSLE